MYGTAIPALYWKFSQVTAKELLTLLLGILVTNACLRHARTTAQSGYGRHLRRKCRSTQFCTIRAARLLSLVKGKARRSSAGMKMTWIMFQVLTPREYEPTFFSEGWIDNERPSGLLAYTYIITWTLQHTYHRILSNTSSSLLYLHSYNTTIHVDLFVNAHRMIETPQTSDDQAVEWSFWQILWQMNYFCTCYVIRTDLWSNFNFDSGFAYCSKRHTNRLMSYVWRSFWKKRVFSNWRFEPMTSGT